MANSKASFPGQASLCPLPTVPGSSEWGSALWTGKGSKDAEGLPASTRRPQE